jgi:hypothetical protein
MITYERSGTLRWVVLALAVAAGGGAYWWFSHEGAEGQEGVAQTATKGGIPGWPQATPGTDEAAAALKPPILDDGRPSDVQTEDWASLSAALAKQSAPKGEGERIVSYLRYQHSFEAWQALEDPKDVRKRHSMAQALLNEVPERLTKGEFTPVEANIMATVLLADLEPDEAKRNQRVEEIQAKLNAIKPQSEDEKVMQSQTRETELKRRQATAFGEWQAKTDPAERTQAKLDQALEEVRRAYNSGEF